MIRIDKLDKYYNKGQVNEIHVLDRISLELPDKGMVAVFGRSGCGKTTLLNVCGGLDRFSGGSILVNGEDIRKNTDALRNREIGYIFQNYNLNMKENVQENVADALRLVGMKDEAEISRRTEAALAAVGMSKYRLRKPNTLSGGQQQRVAIARAIVKNPPVILADEPTGNLDEANTLQVMDMLRSLADEHLVVLVTHEAKLVDLYCDRVIQLSDGHVVRVYDNENVSGADAAGRGEIWLGEMPKNETVWRFADVEYYGAAPEEPLRLVVVNQDGRMYLKVETPHVQVLDDSSEVKLMRGKYEARPEAGKRTSIDLSELPPVTAGVCGRLFHLKNSLKSGWEAVSRKNRKKGSRLLRLVMLLFAAILVLMSASFGTGFRERGEAAAAAAPDMYYVRVGSSRQLEIIRESLTPENGFDGIYYRYVYGDELYRLPEFQITPGYFLTSSAMESALSAKLSPLSRQQMPAGAKALAGDPAAEGAVLTKAAADEMLRASSVGYLKEYPDLIGLDLTGSPYSNTPRTLRIAAVVEGGSKAVYLPENELADWLMKDENLPFMRASSVKGFDAAPEDGSIALVIYSEMQGGMLKEGDTVRIRGVELTVGSVLDVSKDKKEPFYTPYYYDDRVHYEPLFWFDAVFLLTDADYNRAAMSLGRTDGAVTDLPYYDLDSEESRYMSWTASAHAADPAKAEKAAAALSEAGLTVCTPEEAREEAMRDARAGTRSRLIALAVMLVILSLCMYFIMRAGLMSRIREVGIYRAIGVTKGNLVFRFLVEAVVLCGTTVLAGFFLMSLVMRHWVTNSALMKMLFHYPVWMMLLLFVLLLLLSTFCGVLPVLLLLRKTPSEILAKYDI